MSNIQHITARQILDSRGRPTVEATVTLSDGTIATSSVPSGNISNEQVEAVELRDHVKTEYFGLGVSKAVALINGEINQKLTGQDPLYQTKIDQLLVDLDGTKNKSRLGSNTILAVSQAVMKAAAASLRLPLFVYVKEKYQLISAFRIPSPIFNLINGGRHGGGTLDFQEFQLVPASHLPYNQALKIGVEMFMSIEEVLKQKGALTNVGLEGGFAPNLATNTDALEIFAEAAKAANYTISKDAFLGIDVGSDNFHKSGKYTIKDRSQPMSGKDFAKYLKKLHEQYRVFAFEDPLVPEAWSDWKFITGEMGETAMIIADDLIATNKTLLMKAIEEKACNALVIKPNRIGTITEAIEVASIAKQAGWHTIMSHRSSETTDDVLADIAVGIGTDYVKFGAPSRGERVVKYNRLLRIEEILMASTQPAMQTAPTSPTYPASQPEPSNQTAQMPAPATEPVPAQAPISTPQPSPMSQDPTNLESIAMSDTTPTDQVAQTPPNVEPQPNAQPQPNAEVNSSPSSEPTPLPAEAPISTPTSAMPNAMPSIKPVPDLSQTPTADSVPTPTQEPASAPAPMRTSAPTPTPAPAQASTPAQTSTPTLDLSIENNESSDQGTDFTPAEVFSEPEQPGNQELSKMGADETTPAPTSSPTPAPTQSPETPEIPDNADEVQDSLNELVQMVQDIPVVLSDDEMSPLEDSSQGAEAVQTVPSTETGSSSDAPVTGTPAPSAMPSSAPTYPSNVSFNETLSTDSALTPPNMPQSVESTTTQPPVDSQDVTQPTVNSPVGPQADEQPPTQPTSEQLPAQPTTGQDIQPAAPAGLQPPKPPTFGN